MCACLAPKWAGLVGRSAALCHEEGGGGRGAALRWPLTNPRNKAEQGAEKKSALTSSFSPHDVRLLCWTSSELLLCLSAAFISPDISAGGGVGGGWRGRESTWDEMMSTQDSSDVSLWTAEATYRNRQRCFFLTDIKLDMHTHTPTLNQRY